MTCQGERYAGRVAESEVGHPCRHGHGDCATHDGGPCANEVAAQCAADGCAECGEAIQ